MSASFGRQIARSAIYAIFFSLFLVTLWVTFRFQWKFAVGVMVALLHDVLIAVGIYALAGFEVTTATVAAFLTVLGYSMYDTVIILDRIRENIPLMRRTPIAHIANVSLWETIRRSLATTFITMLPLLALYFFGGETLKDFAFALLIGIGSGAYSSIFIAAPVVAMLKEREPEYARLKDGAEDDAGARGRLGRGRDGCRRRRARARARAGCRGGLGYEARRPRRQARTATPAAAQPPARACPLTRPKTARCARSSSG